MSPDVARQATFFLDTVLVDTGASSHPLEYTFHVRLYTGFTFDPDIHLVEAVGTNFTLATDIERGIQITEGEFVPLRITSKIDLVIADIDLDAYIIQTQIIPDEPAINRHQLVKVCPGFSVSSVPVSSVIETTAETDLNELVQLITLLIAVR